MDRHRHLRRAPLAVGVALALCSATTLALASGPTVAEPAANHGPAPPPCVPSTLNRSAVLPGTSIAVSPLPGSLDASPYSQISLLGAPIRALSDVTVSGSHTGSHAGRLRAYSQGDGASFVASRPFSSGETVTVRGRVRAGSAAAPFAFSFVVATQDVLPYAKPASHPDDDPNEVQHFQSRPELHPPVVAVTQSSPDTAPGYLFAAPYSGPGPSGLMIFDEAGALVWFHPLPTGTEATNLQVQSLGGQPVLTWWQGYIPPQGFGEGEEVIDNSSYRQIGQVRAGNGYKADLHDFHITPQNTALITVFNPIYCNLSAVGGPAGGAVTDAVMQEIDLLTGLVRREWHSLDHVALTESYQSPTSASPVWPFDYFHLNSIDQQPDGTTLISSRNTSALYELNTRTGQVLSQIGGRHSSVRLPANASTAYQHDATVLENGTISVFDNGAVPVVHPQSRGIVLAIDSRTDTGTLVAEYKHPRPLSSYSEGNMQQLPNGDMFVGWGAEPYFSEFSAAGALLFDAHFHGSYESYRTYRFPWTGTPAESPAIAVSPAPATASNGGLPTVYASWNGDTRTASWRLLAGPTPEQLTPVASAARTGFETTIEAPAAAPYFAVQALDAAGAVLGGSRAIAG